MRPSPDGLSAALLHEVAETWGTPVYVLSPQRLRANLDTLARALAPARILYSLKTNYLPAVTTMLRAAGAGVDVVSGYELRAALDAGFPTDRIVFNGPVKTAAELRDAVDAGVFVNIDGEEEIEILSRLAAGRAEPLPVGLRVYPPEDVYPSVDRYPPGAPYPEPGDRPVRRLPSKFGWPIATGDADRMVERILDCSALRLTGVHCHLGSQITRTDALLAAMGSLIGWVAELRRRAPVERLNVGGGIGVPGIQRIPGAVAGLSEVRAAREEPPPPPLSVPGFGAGLRELLRAYGLTGLTLECEPGRALVSDAMALVTRVVGVKRTGQGTWVLLDGGLNLLPTAGVAERHRYELLRDGTSRAPEEPVMLGGPLCYEGDVFSLTADLPGDVHTGDVVVVHDAGAYSVTRATSFNRPRIPVVAVSDGRSALCWRGESYEDIFRFAVAPGRHAQEVA
ncbi:diaminopimelate decarboxylase family protein [Planosporangium sp. 12N6]|uniref:diaminopimelate decarboxylase family protein n=1 Tax=Planosporangium spinosum TaxID=3402278 RepID=UPI003CED9FC8